MPGTRLLKRASATFICTALSLSGALDENDSNWEGRVQLSGSNVTIETKTVRCLASLTYTFAKRYRVPVTYEDAPLEFISDLTDATAQEYKSQHQDRAYIPRGGPLMFDFPIDPANQEPVDPKGAMSRLLRAYKGARYPGEYALAESGGMLHIIPSATRDAKGQIKVVVPLMDSRLSLRDQEAKSVGDFIRAVLKNAANGRGQRIVLGTPFPIQLERTPFAVGPGALSAREALSRAIDAGGAGKMSWLLLYDPTFKYYVFTLYQI